MSPQSSGPERNPVPIALCMMVAAFVVAVLCAATAHAAYYKTLYCAAAHGSGNPVKGARPGFFDFTDDCGTAYGDPAGTGGFLVWRRTRPGRRATKMRPATLVAALGRLDRRGFRLHPRSRLLQLRLAFPLLGRRL